MEKLGGSGDGTSNHLSQTSNNITIPLDTILKDKEILSYEGPRAFESNWKLSSPSLQTSNGQILANQHNNESCIRKSMVSIHRQTGQNRNLGCTAVLPKENYPQQELKHFCSNDRPPETSATAWKLLLQKCPIQLSSSSFRHQNASSASTTTNISQQSMPHMIVLNTNNFSGSWKNNLYSQQQHVKIANNLPKDSICQGLVTDVGRCGFILAQSQPVKLCQQNACMPKDSYQQRYAPQKAIAVVTPLTQQVVAGVTFSKNLTKVKEGGHETRYLPNKNNHHPYIPHTLQSTTNENGTKTLYDNTSQTKEVPSKSVLATGFSHCVKNNGPAESNKLPGQSERLSSVPLNSVSIERKEVVQPYLTDNNCSPKFLSEDDATVMGRNSEGTETRMDARMQKLSTIPVNEWSLQRLQTLVTDLEQIQKRQQKDIPFNDLSSEILKLYWNGDYQKLCNAAKSSIYINIMKEVRLHCGTENSVILQGVSRERLNEIASSFHILEHGIAPPKMVYTSSWLNLSEKLYDMDKEHDCLSSLMTLHCKTKIADKDVPMKEMENRQEPTDEKLKASNKALSEGEKQSKPLPPEHQKNSNVKGDKMVRNEPVVMDAENTCSVRETEGQDSMTVNVIKKRVQSEKQNKTKGENEAPLLVSSSTHSLDVSDSCIKPGNLFKLPTTDVTPRLDKNGFTDCISVEMSILPPEKARRLFAGEPDEEVDNRQKEDAQILTDSKGQVTVELFDQDKKHMATENKSDERSNRIKINWQLENYCCLAKWFHVLGYRNGGLCKCEKKAEVSHHANTSGKGVKEVNADKLRHPFNKACKFTDTDICVLRDNRQAKNRLGYRSMTGKNSVTSPIDDDDDDDDDASIDEIEIVDVITNYEDVLKMANAMSEQMETPLIAHTARESTSGRKHCRAHKKITTPKFKTGDTLINLALFGTSHMRQKKNTSGFMSSDKVHLPPETINVRVGSGWNEYPKSQTPKQQVWNSWKKTYVPSKMSTNKRSKMRKSAKAPESKNDAADNSVIKTTAFDLITTLLSHEEDAQTDKQKNTDRDQSKKKSRKKLCSTRKDKIRKLKLNKILASFNLNKRWNYANNGSKLRKSSFDQAQAINTSKNKLNTGLALNFGVLPESFVISDGSSSMEAKQSASADSGSKVKTVMQTKRTWGMSGAWCDSPRKKQCLKSTPTQPNTSGPSTFQEFKKKYEEKKQRIPT
ncbi:hypothetical protein PGIGA_G00257020 [Pangasianodon gigas]|uniref:Uncharacterized protein n=1 Tax=Pangasianodon gigas TaxID=30993 RepID=A0ACC5WT72_PANGG|nr:hypothetical protein [Pangasianodon gigas]